MIIVDYCQLALRLLAIGYRRAAPQNTNGNPANFSGFYHWLTQATPAERHACERWLRQLFGLGVQHQLVHLGIKQGIVGTR